MLEPQSTNLGLNGSIDKLFSKLKQATNRLHASISSAAKQGFTTHLLTFLIGEILWNWEAYKKHWEHWCQTIIS